MFNNKVVWLVYGGRLFSDKKLLHKVLDSQLPKIVAREKENNPRFKATRDLIILDGAAKGVDRLAHKYALLRKIESKSMEANWTHKGAGMQRNTDMVAIADYATGFWNGESNGTRDSLNKIQSKGIPSFTFLYPAFLCEKDVPIKWYITGRITKERYLELAEEYEKHMKNGDLVTLITDGLEHSSKMNKLAKKLGCRIFNLGSTVGGLFTISQEDLITRCILHSTKVTAFPPMQAAVLEVQQKEGT